MLIPDFGLNKSIDDKTCREKPQVRQKRNDCCVHQICHEYS